ncbi:MAG: 16S rRNA processing protein RimM [Candidatus Midichloriaceae bacterium]
MFTITSSHGIHGLLNAHSDFCNSSVLNKIDCIYDQSFSKYSVVIKFIKNYQFHISFKDITTRTEADKLKNKTFYFKKLELYAKIGGESIENIKIFIPGFTIYSETGTELGVVDNITNFGAGDLLHIIDNKNSETKNNNDFFYPFDDMHIKEINFKSKTVTLPDNYTNFF